jgi:hypothetical protein
MANPTRTEGGVITYGFSAYWENYDAIFEAIEQLDSFASREQIQSALRPGAELIAEAWRQRVPQPGAIFGPSGVGGIWATGNYRDSIRVEESNEEESVDEWGLGLDILTDAVSEDGYNYPYWLEFGTSTHAAYPSAMPAFYENEEMAVELAVHHFNDLIMKTFSR